MRVLSYTSSHFVKHEEEEGEEGPGVVAGEQVRILKSQLAIKLNKSTDCALRMSQGGFLFVINQGSFC